MKTHATALPPKADMRFDGPEYQPGRDRARLSGQILRVFSLMQDGEWRTLRRIAFFTQDPEASISAQLRHLRKARFGKHTVERRPAGGGAYEYRLIVNLVEPTQSELFG